MDRLGLDHGLYRRARWVRARGGVPLEDFVAKYVVDPELPRRYSQQFPNNGDLWTARVVDGFPIVSSLTVGLLIPGSVGEHVVDVDRVFSGMQCDGLGDVIARYPGGSWLEAGENSLGALQFTVTPGGAE